MYTYTVGHTRPISTGIFLPDQEVTSEDLMREAASERFGISHDWMDQRMGIHTRRYVEGRIQPSEMAIFAARQALERAPQVPPEEIGVLIYAGMDRDFTEPATAHLVQAALGLRHAICMDLSNACHGFMNALHVVDALIATGQARYGLVVTGEQPSHVARETLRQIRRIRSRKRFMSLIGGLSVGDAGAAMLVGPRRGPDEGFAGFMLASDGRHHDLCVLRKGKTVYGHMHMREIVREIVDLHAKLYPRTLERLGWQPGLIDSFVHHQVGKRPFRMHAEYAGIGLDIMPNTVGHLGNITSATIPVNLHLLENAGTLADGARVFVAGTGSGLSVSQAGLLWKAA